MKRTSLIAALVGAAILAIGTAVYFTDTIEQRPGALAILTPPVAKTTPFWPARVSLLAGDGRDGVIDGPANASRLSDPYGVAIGPRGTVYFADGGEANRIRLVQPDGTVSTLAGGKEGFIDGPGAAAAFHTPSAVALDHEGNLYVADTGNHAVRRVKPDGTVDTLAIPLEGEVRPPLRRPAGLALTRDGYLYIAASAGGRILQLTPEGEMRPLQDVDRPLDPNGFGSDGTLQMYGPRGIAVGRDGSLVVADATAHRLHRLAPPREGEAAPVMARPALVKRSEPMPWPVGPQDMVHEVVGVMGEVRGAYNGDSRHHFHAGLDVRADVGAKVLAVFPAKVTDPHANWGFNTLSEGLSVGPLSYIHMRVGRDPQGRALDPRFQILRDAKNKAERVRVPRGTRFAVGDALGTINAMAHVHLDYYQGGNVVNPLTLPFVGFTDTVPPVIDRIALYDTTGKGIVARKGQPIRLARSLGEIQVVVNAYDQVNGNLARRKLGLYKLGYQLLRADGTPLAGFEQPVITQVYDRLPRNQDAVKAVYAPTSGITVYGSKSTQFDYALNNRLHDGEIETGSWRIGELAPGPYILRIHAADFSGQVAQDGRDLAFVIE